MNGIVGSWDASVVQRWTASGPGAALAVVFPAYRPDLVALLAARLKTGFCDFRQTRMQPLGWAASRLPLAALDTAIAEEMSADGDVTLHNVEALLSVHCAAARRDWLAAAFRRRWPARLLLPLMLYGADVGDDDDEHVVRLPADMLPAETLLDRLNGMR